MDVGWHSFFSTDFSGYVYELRELLKQADDFE